ILHTGPLGLGILRSAPALGALAAGILLARKPIKGRAGRTLLIAVGTFGVAMVVFGLSRWFLLSLVALAVSGYVDMYSMNIRSTTIALAAPNLLRGRGTAVENVFIGTSTGSRTCGRRATTRPKPRSRRAGSGPRVPGRALGTRSIEGRVTPVPGTSHKPDSPFATAPGRCTRYVSDSAPSRFACPLVPGTSRGTDPPVVTGSAMYQV